MKFAQVEFFATEPSPYHIAALRPAADSSFVEVSLPTAFRSYSREGCDKTYFAVGYPQAFKMKIISCVLFIASFVGVALAAEWNCADTSGVFERSTDCTMTDEVAVSGDLTVTGNENTYTTLIAASGTRHFKIDSGTPTLRLK